MGPKIFLYITFVIKVSQTKFDINWMTNVRVRAKTFHCSNLTRQKWSKFWPYGPKNISLHYFVIKVSQTKFDINWMTNVWVRAKTFHCSNLARQKFSKFWPHGSKNIYVCHFCHKSVIQNLTSIGWQMSLLEPKHFIVVT